MHGLFTKTEYKQKAGAQGIPARRHSSARRWVAVLVCLVAAVLASTRAPLHAQTIEIRAVHVAASDWAEGDPATREAALRTVFETVHRAGFNTVFFQAREGAETLFPSEIDPWSRRVGYRHPGFDPLATAIEEGRRRDLRVYAWTDLASLGLPPPPGADFEAVASRHSYARHGPDAEDSRVCRAPDGAPVLRDGEPYLSPGIPEVQAYLRRVVLELVAAYPDLDGLYLDKLGYPDARASHDERSVSRYQGPGNPGRAFWDNWQREQLTRFMADLSVQVRARRPRLVLAVAAEGVHSRSRFEGDPDLPSGFHDRYMDERAWAADGWVDFVVPRLDDALLAKGRTFQEFVEDAFALYTEPRLVVGLDLGTLEPENETETRARYPTNTGALGIAALSFAPLADNEPLATTIRERLFPGAALPTPLRAPERAAQGAVLVRVLDTEGAPVVDARARLDGVRGVRLTSGDGVVAFPSVRSGERSLNIEYFSLDPVAETVSVAAGEVVEIEVRLAGLDAVSPVYLEIFDPADGRRTTDDAVNVLGRVRVGTRVRIDDDAVPVLSTGLFVRDQIPLDMGENTIEVVATDPEGVTVRRTLTVTRTPRPTPTPIPPSFPLFIVEDSFEPSAEVRLAPGEPIRFAFVGAPNNIAEVRVPWMDEWIPLVEEGIPGTRMGTGRYAATRALVRLEDASPGNLEVRLRVPEEVVPPVDSDDPREILFVPRTGISLYGNDRYRHVRVSDDVAPLMFGLHSVRLGGPYLAELPKGTSLQITGRRGNFYRVRLANSLDAWVAIDSVENVAPTERIPRLHFTSVSIYGDDYHDVVRFPYSAPVPFRVVPVTRPGQPAALEVDFFHAHDAATWISHKATARLVRVVTTEQIESDWLRVRIELDGDTLWGYSAKVEGTALHLRIRRAPDLVPAPDSPLRGLTVAVEAGHGGPTNTGAMGVSGTPEKTINRWTADTVMELLRARGASVVDCRIGDETISLARRIQRAEDADADLFISIHANAASQARGYLRVSGTSTYYKWPWSYDFSKAVQQRLLAMTGLDDFGNVGNFNYTPIRTTWMPAILVELAFMSNPEDEAKMLDPEFRRRMAEAIVLGTEDYLAAHRK